MTAVRPTQSTTSTARLRSCALAMAAATLAPLAVWLISVPLARAALAVRPGGGAAQTVSAGAVLAVALVASGAGWVLLAVLERRTARARRLWTGIALAVLLLSLAGPLTAAVTATTAVVLVLMHLAVGGCSSSGCAAVDPIHRQPKGPHSCAFRPASGRAAAHRGGRCRQTSPSTGRRSEHDEPNHTAEPFTPARPSCGVRPVQRG